MELSTSPNPCRRLAVSAGFSDALPHVLLFADWPARGAVPRVCKTWRDGVKREDAGEAHWKFLCERLRDEHRLYVPAGICPTTDGWRAHFDKLWQQRNLWKVDERATAEAAAAAATATAEEEEEQADGAPVWRPQQQLSEETFNVSVSVRFRPAVATAGGKDAATAEGDAVVMPLHQRVAMVRAKHGYSQAKAMRIVMKQEAMAKKKAAAASGSGQAEEQVMDECTIAVGKAMSQSQLDSLEAAQKRAAEAHLAAEDDEEMDRHRRLKPHLFGARHKKREPSFADEQQALAEDRARLQHANRVEQALFDRGDEAEAAAAAEAEAEGATTRGLVMVRSVPVGVTCAEVVHFFDDALVASAGADSERATNGRVLGGEFGVHLFFPGDAAAEDGDAASSSSSSLLSSSPMCGRAGEAFVQFASSEAADQAVAFRDGCKLHGKALEVFRATEDHMAATLAEARNKERAAMARRAEEARAHKEAKRLETIAAARAARAAEKERHKQDAENLKAAKAKAAEEAGSAESSGVSPYGTGGGKENSPGGEDEEKGGKGGGGGGGGGGAASDTKAAIVNVASETAQVLAMAPGCGLRPFQFERVFDADAKQEHVYELCGRSAVADVLNGQSACVLVYGQTGAGKTHTMFGDGTADPRLGSSRYGIVPRVCEELVQAMEGRKSLGIDAQLSVAYVEVYGAEVTDLLRGGSTIGASDDGADNHFHAHRWVLEGRADVPVESVGGALELIAKGDAHKRRAATAMNERSSRAHALFILSLNQTEASSGIERTTRLFLADLGGSEKLTKSQAADDFKSHVVTIGGEEVSRLTWAEYYAHRGRLQESLNINVGLYALQRCIECLIQRDKLRAEGRAVHVPFADSKLTLMLKDALMGGARTTVLVCASLEPRNAVESISSLRFGEACGRIEMRNKGSGDGAAMIRRLVKELDDEIAATQAIIVRDQRWEKQVKTITSVVAGGFHDLDAGIAGATVTKDIGDAEVDLGEVAAGVAVIGIDLAGLMKGGLTRYSATELKEALESRKLDTSGDKQALYERLKEALEAEDAKVVKETVTHEVVANVLVGAEEAEAKLEALLQRKRELLGEV